MAMISIFSYCNATLRVSYTVAFLAKTTIKTLIPTMWMEVLAVSIKMVLSTNQCVPIAEAAISQPRQEQLILITGQTAAT
jgi:hypothetical protein